MKAENASSLSKLIEVLSDKHLIWVLTGAGISKPSGIPTYRNHQGQWQAGRPVQHGEFINQIQARQRYWARSMLGWHHINKAEPNDAHRAIVKLQQQKLVNRIVTQNVDRLHSLAGARNVIDLHGRLDQVICLDCNDMSKRADYQGRLENGNPEINHYVATYLPDGDASIEDFDMTKVNIPACENCGGVLMPDVVFFGGTVPQERVKLAYDDLKKSDCVLVIGSSLSVYSGYRFPRWAHQQGLPLYAINQGRMRGAEMFDRIVSMPCEKALPVVVDRLLAS